LCRDALRDNVRMAFDGEQRPRHFLREWRKSKDYSLETVAERVELLGAEPRFKLADSAGRRTMTHATLSRIERGLLPYNQVLLEILAEIYSTDVASLLMRNPLEGAGIWSIWDQLTTTERSSALTMLTALVEKRTGTRG